MYQIRPKDHPQKQVVIADLLMKDWQPRRNINAPPRCLLNFADTDLFQRHVVVFQRAAGGLV